MSSVDGPSRKDKLPRSNARVHDETRCDDEVAAQLVRNWVFFEQEHSDDALVSASDRRKLQKERRERKQRLPQGGSASGELAEQEKNSPDPSIRLEECRRRCTLSILWRLALITTTRRWTVSSMAFLKSQAMTLQSMCTPACCGERVLRFRRVHHLPISPDILALHKEASALAFLCRADGVLVGPGAAVPLVYSDRRESQLRTFKPNRPGQRRERKSLQGLSQPIEHLGWYVAHYFAAVPYADIAANPGKPWQGAEVLEDSASVDETEDTPHSAATIRSAVARVRELVSRVEEGYLLPVTNREASHPGLVRSARPAVPVPVRGRPKGRRS
jgi:hypothetical protein